MGGLKEQSEVTVMSHRLERAGGYETRMEGRQVRIFRHPEGIMSLPGQGGIWSLSL